MNFVHIGLPKTASTTLQDRLFVQQSEFSYVGRVNNDYRHEATKELINRIRLQDLLDYDHADAKALLHSVPEVAAAPERPILVSAETFSVEGRADRRLIAQRLHQLFAPAKVLIVIRAQPTLIQSLYLQHLRGSGQRITAFDHWLDQTYGGTNYPDVYRTGLNYEPLVRAYDEIFGQENVVVLPFELIRDENSVFHASVAELLKIPLAAVQASFRQNDNQRMSKRHLMALHIQGVMPTGTNLAQVGRRLLPMTLYSKVRNIVVAGRRLESPPISERWRSRLAAMCGRANAQLEVRTGLPLGALGYPVTV